MGPPRLKLTSFFFLSCKPVYPHFQAGPEAGGLGHGQTSPQGSVDQRNSVGPDLPSAIAVFPPPLLERHRCPTQDKVQEDAGLLPHSRAGTDRMKALPPSFCALLPQELSLAPLSVAASNFPSFLSLPIPGIWSES